MKRPLYEQEQARKVKTRFRMLQHDLPQRQPDLPVLWHLPRSVLHLAPSLREERDGRSAGPVPQTVDDSLPHSP